MPGKDLKGPSLCVCIAILGKSVLSLPECTWPGPRGRGEEKQDPQYPPHPPPSGPRGRQLMCLDSLLASAPASDIFPFIAVPVLGLIDALKPPGSLQLDSSRWCSRWYPRGPVCGPRTQEKCFPLALASGCGNCLTHGRSAYRCCRHPGASAQMMLKNGGRRSF